MTFSTPVTLDVCLQKSTNACQVAGNIVSVPQQTNGTVQAPSHLLCEDSSIEDRDSGQPDRIHYKSPTLQNRAQGDRWKGKRILRGHRQAFPRLPWCGGMVWRVGPSINVFVAVVSFNFLSILCVVYFCFRFSVYFPLSVFYSVFYSVFLFCCKLGGCFVNQFWGNYVVQMYPKRM